MPDGIEVGHAYVSVSASGKDAVKQVASDFDKGMPDAGKKAGAGLGGGIVGAASKFAGPLAALFAGEKILSFFGEANDEAREAQKVGATTTQIIEATGGAAKITASQVGDLATAISNKSGMDDEAIQKGANLLLTFKNVRNEAGEGAKIFDRATQSAVDLSAAGFGSVEGASKMLGKALNDPVKGISALGRAGVTFTDGQKEQIKTLVASGKTLDAQKIIMKEVESQVGGVAAASATAGEKMAVAFGNFKEQVGTALLPVIDRLANVVTTQVIPALSRVVSFLVANVGPAFNRVRAFIEPLFAEIRRGGESGSFLQTRLVPAFQGIVTAGQRLAAVVLPVIRAIAAEFARRWPQIRPIVMGIFKTIGQIVTDVMTMIRRRIEQVTTVIRFIWSRWGKQITAVVGNAFSILVGVIGGAMKIIGGIIRTVTAVLTGDWRRAGDGIKQIVRGLRDVVVAVFGGMAEKLRTTVRNLMSTLRDRFSSGVDAIGRAWSRLKDKAKEPVRFVINTVINGGLIKAFNSIASKVGASTLPNVPSFDVGGWTGPGPRLKPAGVVHADEHVWTKAEMRRFPGGHRAMERFRAKVRRGAVHGPELPGYAGGGAVGKLASGAKAGAGFVWDTVTKLVKMGGTLKNALSKALGDLSSVGSGAFGDLARGIARKVSGAMYEKGRDWVQKIVTRIKVPISNSKSSYKGPVGAGAAGIRRVANSFSPSYIAGHRDPQGLPAFDIGSSGAKNNAIANALRTNHGKLGLRYVISQMRIASAKHGWGWGRYSPITNQGDWRHVNHVHVSYDNGGVLQPGFSATYNGTGKPEAVLTNSQWDTARKAIGSAGSGALFGGPVTIQGYTAEEVAREIELQRRRKASLNPVFV